MKLRVLTPVLIPAALLCAAAAPAQAIDLPLQLSQFLTGGKGAKPTAPKAAAEQAAAAPARHRRVHHAERHVARHHHVEPTPHEGEPEAAAVAASPLPAAAPAAPSPAAAAAAQTAAVEPTTADGVRIVSPDQFNEIDAAANDAVNPAAPEDFESIIRPARPAPTTDGRGAGSADTTIGPDPQPAPEPATPAAWPRLLAIGLGGPLLIGLLAWPLVSRFGRRKTPHLRTR